MGLLNWIIRNIQVLIEILYRLLTGNLEFSEGWSYDWDCHYVSFPMYYFEAIQFLFVILFVLLVLLLGLFIGYRLHKWRGNTD